MKQKLFLLLFLSLSLLGLYVTLSPVTAQSVGCCISATGGCQDAKTSSECAAAGGQFTGGQTCASLNDQRCVTGCCCQAGSATVGVEKVKCGAQGQQHFPGVTNNVICNSKCGIGPPACPNLDCSAQIQDNYLGCACGSVNTTSQNPFCCRPTNSVHAAQNQCPAACAPVTTYSLEGVVYGRTPGGTAPPLANATVTILNGPSNTTDENGRWSIGQLSPATYQIQVSKPGYETFINRSVVVLDRHVVNFNVFLPAVTAPQEVCNDAGNADEDENGYANACDASCNVLRRNIRNRAGSPPPPYTPSTESCSDGIDNDCNGATDCLDPACVTDATCQPGGVCGDNITQLPNKDGKFEECDGSDSRLCPGRCGTAGPNACMCPVTCGDLIIHGPPRGNEQCDARYDANNNKVGGFDLACSGRCNSTSCQCIPITPVCGNNVREGNEQCDGTDNVGCGGFACIPSERPNACTCKRDFVCGDGKIDVYEDCDKGNPPSVARLDAACPGQCSHANCTCPVSCNQNPIDPTLNPIVTQRYQRQLALTWKLEPSSVCLPSYYYVLRCDKPENECKTRPDLWSMIATNLQTLTFDDKDIVNNTNYCYKVVAKYDAAQINPITDKESAIQCKMSGDKDCYERTTEFCQDKARFGCDTENRKGMIENCTQTAGFACIGPFSDGSTKCAFQSPCDDCNDPLGAFGLHPSARASYSLTGLSPVPTPCKDIPVCYFDYTSTPIDKYYACALVHSCYDYKSKTACDTDNAKCRLGPCEWLPNRFTELGGGVCRPVAKEKQDCSRCDNPFNAFLGKCDTDACALYGECHYNGVFCKGKNTVACADYRERRECAPTRNVQVDVAYTQSIRSGGSHNLLVRSDDLFNISKCRWVEEKNQCIKDADTDTQDDCATGDTICNSDIEPPQTLFNPIKVSTGAIRIPFTVRDNVYARDKIQTFYSIGATATYPTILARNNLFSHDITDQTLSGNYVLSYYSIDDAKNLEPVRTMTFYVDTVPPGVTVTTNITSLELPSGDFTSHLDVTMAVTDNVVPQVVCNGNLTRENTILQPVLNTGLRNLPITQHTVQYAGLPDDDYVFAFECIDRAGNLQTGQQRITVRGDQSVTDPLPNMTLAFNQNIELSVRTPEPATCKYSDSTNDFSRMNFTFVSFADGEKIKHTSRVFVPGLQTSKVYFVRCFFPRMNKIRGNASSIRFAVDMVPPRTTVNYNGEFLRGQTSFQLSCRDPELVENNFHWEFGCAKTYFCLGLGCNATTEYRSSIILNTTTPLTFYSIDKGGNKEPAQTVIPSIDGTPPSFIFSILDILPTPHVVTTVTRLFPPNYIINITASEPLMNITELFFTYPNGTVSLLNVTPPYPVNIEKTEWHAQLALFNIRNVNAPAQFGIRAFDQNRVPGVAITQGRDFRIDTRIADPPTFDPPIATYMNLKGGIYYTNGAQPIMPGYTKLQEMYVNYYLGLFPDQQRLVHVYREPETHVLVQPTIDIDTLQGATSVKLRQELPISTDHFVEFLYVNDTSGGHFRSYPPYKDFYRITNVQRSGGTTLIDVSPALEAPVFSNKIISVFDQPRRPDRFTGSINLSNTYNYLRLNAYQTPFNPTPFTPVHSIFYDYTPPELIDYVPIEGTIGNPSQVLTVKIRELKAGSGIESFRVYVNGVRLIEAPQAISDTENQDYVVQSLSHRDTFNQPRYDVMVRANDSAGNQLDYNYTFYFVANTPDPPVFSIPSGKKVNNKWYVKDTPAAVHLNFSQDVIIKLPLAENVIDQTTIAGGPRGFSGQLRALADGEYSLQAEAFLLGQAAPGKWNFTFVVDKASPSFSLDFPRRARSGRTIRIIARVANERGDVNASLLLGAYRINETFVTPAQTVGMSRTAQDLYAYDFAIPADVPHGVKIPIQVTLRDLVDNLQQLSGEIEIDNIVPGIEVTRVLADRVISFTVGEDIFYHVRDNDDRVTLEGTANKVLSLQYFKETLQPVPLVNNRFSLPIRLVSIDGETVPNFVTFTGQDQETGDSIIFIAKLVSDKQPPSPPVITVSDLENGKVKTPLPVFTVSYNEPVRILAVSLKENAAVTFASSTTDNQTFRFMVQQPLVNRQYTFQIKAEDVLGNAQRSFSELSFQLQANDTEIILVKPRHGAATAIPTDIEVATTRYATCSYAFSATGAYTRFTETGLDQQKLVHRIPGFSQFSATQATPFYVKCNDGLKDMTATFALTVDGRAPQITKAVADPAMIIQQPLQTKLKVETDEVTVCKYSKTSTNYDQMAFFATEDALKRNTYKLAHEQMITLPTVEAGVHTYNVNCEDPASNRAGNRQISFTLVDQELTVAFEEPQAVIGDARVIVKVKTNKDAECTYAFNGTQPMQGNQKDHTLDLGVLPEGRYSGSATCKSFSDIFGARLQEKTASHSFILDLSPPVLNALTVSNASCPDKRTGLYSMTATFNGADNESDIDSYIYTIATVDRSQFIIPDTNSVSSQVFLSRLNFSVGESYVFAVAARNKLNRTSQVLISEPIVVYGNRSQQCLESKPPEISIDVKQTPRGISVGVICKDDTGCDPSTIKYGLSSDTSCTPTLAYTGPLEVSASKTICVIACDTLGNCVTAPVTKQLAFLDADLDSIPDWADKCANTAAGDVVDVDGAFIGCSDVQKVKDTDQDGVPDSTDICADTLTGETVDAKGCSDAQRAADRDVDGVPDLEDKCPDQSGPKDNFGCPKPEADTDGDGVPDSTDKCPATEAGILVDETGCEAKKPTKVLPLVLLFFGLLLIAAGVGYLVYKKYYYEPPKVERASETLATENLQALEAQRRLDEQKQYLEEKRREEIRQRLAQREEERKKLFAGFEKPAERPTAEVKEKVTPLVLEKKYVERTPLMTDVFTRLTKLGREDVFARLDEIIKQDERQQFHKLIAVPKEDIPKEKIFDELAKESGVDREKPKPVSYEELRNVTHPKVEPEKNLAKQMLSATEKEEIRKTVHEEIKKLQEKKTITRQDIIDFISALPKNERIDYHVTQVLLAYLLHHKKMTTEDASTILVELEKKNVLLAEDIADILFHLHLR
ncbi:carboxypeptidase regulatory-like domain-containing protein [Candidatus Woesearchaeota archaeon]|nr:carboxypeptidase regulatory-like domain-containing protein [Candidatus Woesearchaeota archaeon]